MFEYHHQDDIWTPMDPYGHQRSKWSFRFNQVEVNLFCRCRDDVDDGY